MSLRDTGFDYTKKWRGSDPVFDADLRALAPKPLTRHCHRKPAARSKRSDIEARRQTGRVQHTSVVTSSAIARGGMGLFNVTRERRLLEWC